MITLAFVVGSYSLFHGYIRHHRNTFPILIFSSGFIFLVLKQFFPVQEYLFLPKRNPQTETWNGRMYANEDATRISGLKTIVNASELTTYLTALGKKDSFKSKDGVSVNTAFETVYLLLPEDERDADGLAGEKTASRSSE